MAAPAMLFAQTPWFRLHCYTNAARRSTTAAWRAALVFPGSCPAVHAGDPAGRAFARRKLRLLGFFAPGSGSRLPVLRRTAGCGQSRSSRSQQAPDSSPDSRIRLLRLGVMGDTSERSEAALPPRCPCGFWGSSKTLNLCSKCFADVQKKQPDDDCTPPPIQAPPSSQTLTLPSSSAGDPVFSRAVQVSCRCTHTSPLSAGASSTDSAQDLPCTPTKRPGEAGILSASSCAPPIKALRSVSSASASCSESGPSPGKRPREGAAEEEAPTQKNRRRCFLCQSKLELVQQELGGCRCGFIFCMRHRLPEQHDCRFDHLGRGRRDAVLKMVKLERKVGRACQRIGEGCS
ncbi:AN1-type zinc finger protein 3 [Oryzias melastigma]|uniref:AN1-type zinc finger protein 3 n=1 Tax=Oryzias melastigma TaxID=30732 RepID=A0A834C6X2_ORYME|nr:AN1-type zinc finger protein 3 [Oryzias melastigma]